MFNAGRVSQTIELRLIDNRWYLLRFKYTVQAVASYTLFCSLNAQNINDLSHTLVKENCLNYINLLYAKRKSREYIFQIKSKNWQFANIKHESKIKRSRQRNEKHRKVKYLISNRNYCKCLTSSRVPSYRLIKLSVDVTFLPRKKNLVRPVKSKL